MSNYKSELQANNIDLQSILNKINNLPSNGGSSNGSENEDLSAFIEGTITSCSNGIVSKIRNYAFYNCSSLTTANFPEVTTIGAYAFSGCGSLTSISFPKVTSIGNSAFYNCVGLSSINFPEATSIGSSAFFNCTSLTSISFPKATSIGSNAFHWNRNLTTVRFPKVTSISGSAFYSCYNLISLYLTGSSLCTLANSNAFSLTPIGGYSASAGTYGHIYVPASLLTSYKTATNWSFFSDRIVATALGGGAD